MKKTLIAIDPAGVKHKRTTERDYKHVVMARKCKRHALEVAQEKPVHFDSNFWYHQAYIDGTSAWLERARWETAEKHAERVQLDIKRAEYANRGCATPGELWKLMRAERIGDVEKVDYTKWQALGWCSRRDLAEKLARRGNWAEIVIVDVQ